MKFSNSTRRYTTLGLTLFVIISLFVASFMGKKQDEAFHTDSVIYSQMVQQLQDGNFASVIALSDEFGRDQSSSEAVNYIIGVAATNSGEVEQGLKHMQRVLEINPYKVEDSIFMLQLSEILVIAEKYENAEIVLAKCAELPIPDTYPNYQERVQELQEQLATQL